MCSKRVDLRGGRGASISHDLLNDSQTCIEALHLSVILPGAAIGLLGDHPAHLLFVLKPSPEPDPEHGEEGNTEDRFDQKRFLVGDHVDEAVSHINLPICACSRGNFAR